MSAISPEYEKAFGRSISGRDHWENNGWGLRLLDSKEEVEFLLWTSPYVLRAGTEFVRDITTIQTLLVKRSLRASAQPTDNDFIYSGWDPQDHLTLADLIVERIPKGIDWRIGGRTFTFRDGTWRIFGKSGGVDMDLNLTPFGRPIWYVGPPMDPLRQGEGWYWAFVDANGKLQVNGNQHKVTGSGIHERHIMHDARFDLVKETAGRGFIWFLGLGEKFRFLLSDFGGRGREFFLTTMGFTCSSPSKDVEIKDLEEWVDPRSKFSVPSSFRISVDSEEVRLDAEVRAYCRGYYPWNFMKHSNSVLYFFLCGLVGYYELKSAGWKKVNFAANERCYVHKNWSFHRRA